MQLNTYSISVCVKTCVILTRACTPKSAVPQAENFLEGGFRLFPRPYRPCALRAPEGCPTAVGVQVSLLSLVGQASEEQITSVQLVSNPTVYGGSIT